MCLTKAGRLVMKRSSMLPSLVVPFCSCDKLLSCKMLMNFSLACVRLAPSLINSSSQSMSLRLKSLPSMMVLMGHFWWSSWDSWVMFLVLPSVWQRPHLVNDSMLLNTVSSGVWGILGPRLFRLCCWTCPLILLSSSPGLLAEHLHCVCFCPPLVWHGNQQA